MTLKKAVEGRTGEVSHGRLEGVETVVQRQQGMATKGEEEELLFR
jgi:hypothetical protein